MEIFLDSEGRIAPIFCEDARRAVARIMSDRSVSRAEAERIFIAAFEELAYLAGRYRRGLNTLEASITIERAKQLEILCGLIDENDEDANARASVFS